MLQSTRSMSLLTLAIAGLATAGLAVGMMVRVFRQSRNQPYEDQQTSGAQVELVEECGE